MSDSAIKENDLYKKLAEIQKFSEELEASQKAFKIQSNKIDEITIRLFNNCEKSLQEWAEMQKKFTSTGSELGDTIASGNIAVVNGVKDIIEYVTNFETLAELGGRVSSTINKVSETVRQSGSALVNATQSIVEYVTNSEKMEQICHVTSSVIQSLNEALGRPIDGGMAEYTDVLAGVKEKLSEIGGAVKTQLEPVYEFMNGLAERIGGTFQKNYETMVNMFSGIADTAKTTFTSVNNAFNMVQGGFNTLCDGLSNGASTFNTIAGVIDIASGAMEGYNAIMGILALKEQVCAAAQWLLNAAMSANPVGIIIAAVIALIALIGYLVMKFDGWRETWDNLMEYGSLAWERFKATLKLGWLNVSNFFMTGIEDIQAGWYLLQSLWDKDAAKQGMQNLKAQRDARAQEIAQQKNVVSEINGKMSNLKIIQLRDSGLTLSDMTKKVSDSLGFSTPGADDMGGLGTADGGLNSAPAPGSGGNLTAGAAGQIASGGSSVSYVTINLESLIETVIINSNNMSEGAEMMREIVQDELTRALEMAGANV